jgi:hypothetical protein
MILSIVKHILPQYLVYRSVIRTVSTAMDVVYKTHNIERVSKSIAKDAWGDFVKLAKERMFVEAHAAAWKGKATMCDNINVSVPVCRAGLHSYLFLSQCLKVDAKNNFRKCSACGTTHYCSKGKAILVISRYFALTTLHRMPNCRLEGRRP